MLVVGAVLISLTWFQLWPIKMTEVLGFVTGGICGWLIVREDMLNWPIGLANFLFFAVLFYNAGLYADMAVQVIFFCFSLYGWWAWLRGSSGDKPLAITRTKFGEWITLAIVLPVAFCGMVVFLKYIHDAAPTWDGVTAILSLTAQFLLCQKRLENWYFWIAAQSIYIPLYFYRELPLTAILYVMFLIMCVIGLVTWRKKWKEAQAV